MWQDEIQCGGSENTITRTFKRFKCYLNNNLLSFDTQNNNLKVENQ